MTDNHRLHNPGPDSVVIDSAGHTLDVDEIHEGNPNGVVLSRLISTGQLTDLGPVDGEPPNDESGD
jgi:hypothetical protein